MFATLLSVAKAAPVPPSIVFNDTGVTGEVVSGVTTYLGEWHYIGVVAWIMLGNLGVPLPEEIALLYAGYLSFENGYFGLTVFALLLIVVATDVASYHVGLRVKTRYDRWRTYPTREARVNSWRRKIDRFFDKHAFWAIFISRFFVGFRVIGPLMAAVHHIPLRRFLAADIAAALVQVPIIAWIGYEFHDLHFNAQYDVIKRLAVWFFVALVVGAIAWRAYQKNKN